MSQTTFEGERLLREITERGYYELEHGIPAEEMQEAVQSYADFTTEYPDPDYQTMSDMLPQDLVVDEHGNCKQLDDLIRSNDKQDEWHKYRSNTDGVGKPNGYTNRSHQADSLLKIRGIEVVEDPKEYFHYTPQWLPKVRLNHASFDWGNVPQALLDVDKAFHTIHRKAATIITQTASLIEEVHPEITGFFDRKSLASSPIRLLFYHAPVLPDLPASTQLGAGHYDKGALTVQLAESHLGIRVAPDSDSNLELIKRDATTAILFPGSSMKANFGSDTPFQPGWHDIIKDTRLNEGRFIPEIAQGVCTRWAMIFFANGKGFKNPDKALMHRR